MMRAAEHPSCTSRRPQAPLPLAPNAPRPALLTEAEVCKMLRLNLGRTPDAQRKALDRAWRRAQDIRYDHKLPPLTRIRIGSQRYYEASTISALLEALSFEF